MKYRSRTAAILWIVLLSFGCLLAQNNYPINAHQTLSPLLSECYNNSYMQNKENQIPHTLENFIALIAKIEDNMGPTSLRIFSTMILHRFRQDGIHLQLHGQEPRPGVIPFGPHGDQFWRFSKTLQLLSVPDESAIRTWISNNTLTLKERCSLHFMISSSFDLSVRGDESRTCREPPSSGNTYDYSSYSSSYASNGHQFGKRARFAKRSPQYGYRNQYYPQTYQPSTSQNKPELQSNQFLANGQPNNNQPTRQPVSYAQSYSSTNFVRNGPQAYSSCPTENGVLSMKWGSVAAGPMIAGIAAALERQRSPQRYGSINQQVIVENNYLATIAGDLAEVALKQGLAVGERFRIGVPGFWNSSTQPRWYILNRNEDLEMTDAEIRGDVDGFILSQTVKNGDGDIEMLQLSQILDMYYSDRGFLELQNQACNRRNVAREMLHRLVQNLKDQTFAAMSILKEGLQSGTVSDEIRMRDANTVVDNFMDFLQNNHAFPNECSLDNVDPNNIPSKPKFHQSAVDLKIVVDKDWDFDRLQSILIQILTEIEVNRYNSNFTILDGTGSIIVNSSNNILSIYNLTREKLKFSNQFELSSALNSLESIQARKMNQDQSGKARSDVTILMPFTSNQRFDSYYPDLTRHQLKKFKERIPDAVFFVISTTPSDEWKQIVNNHDTDVILINNGMYNYETIKPLCKQIKQVPKRLLNPQCGFDYRSTGSSDNTIDDYVEPGGVNFYRIHPNYFFGNGDTAPKVVIKGNNRVKLHVAYSDKPLHIDNMRDSNTQTYHVDNNNHPIMLKCNSAATYIQDCESYYIAVWADSSGSNYNDCKSNTACRFPNMIKYTISMEQLSCKSSANSLIVASLIHLILLYCGTRLLH